MMKINFKKEWGKDGGATNMSALGNSPSLFHILFPWINLWSCVKQKSTNEYHTGCLKKIKIQCQIIDFYLEQNGFLS